MVAAIAAFFEVFVGLGIGAEFPELRFQIGEAVRWIGEGGNELMEELSADGAGFRRALAGVGTLP